VPSIDVTARAYVRAKAFHRVLRSGVALMLEDTFEAVFADWKRRAETLDRQLHSIVHEEVDINSPDWEEQLANAPHPANAAGLRNEICALFNEIIDCFESLDVDQRQQIIDLMETNDSLMYSAVIDADYNTPDGFRKHMMLMVIEDQGKDTRDAIVGLAHHRKAAEERGINVDAIFKEMAALASARDKFGWGTTRDLFLKH
jgi:hypothetical protein